MKPTIRSITVLFGGIVLSVVVSATLDHMLMPSGGKLIVQYMSPQSGSSDELRLWGELRRSGYIATYLVGPLTGFAVGIFVGILQKNGAAALAAIALVPDFLYGFLTDRYKGWSHSAVGILTYIFHRSLPFIAAMLAAALFCRLMVDRYAARLVTPASSG